jgi:hypothetical protein
MGVGGNLYGTTTTAGSFYFALENGETKKTFFIQIFGEPRVPEGTTKLPNVQAGGDVNVNISEYFESSCIGSYTLVNSLNEEFGIDNLAVNTSGHITGDATEAGAWDFTIKKGACEKKFRINVTPSTYYRFIDIASKWKSRSGGSKYAKRMAWIRGRKAKVNSALADGDYFNFPNISNILRDGDDLSVIPPHGGLDTPAIQNGIVLPGASVVFPKASSINCTISLWIYLDSEKYINIANNGILDLRVENNKAVLYASSPITPGKWQGKVECPIYSGWTHFVATSDSKEVKLYVNGEIKGVLI